MPTLKKILKGLLYTEAESRVRQEDGRKKKILYTLFFYSGRPVNKG
jgi:hypothetical protein